MKTRDQLNTDIQLETLAQMTKFNEQPVAIDKLQAKRDAYVEFLAKKKEPSYFGFSNV